jgi:hypothetical protein
MALERWSGMSQCQHCSGRVHDAFICHPCQVELKEMLLGLPKWLGYLADAAHGQTRLGESARRSGDLTSPMPCNLSASKIYDDVSNMLWKWVGAVNLANETLNVPGETR